MDGYCTWIHFGSGIVPILRGIVVETKNYKGKNNTVVWVTCVQFVAHNGFTLTVTYHHRVTRRTFSARAACALTWKPSPSLPTLPPIDTPTSCSLRQDPWTRRHWSFFSCLKRNLMRQSFFWRACIVQINSFPPTVLQFHTNPESPVASHSKSRSPA